MPVSLVQRGPFSYDEYTNISSSDASTRTFTLTNAKFDSTIGEVLEVFVDGVKLVGDGTFVTGGSNPGSGASAHEFSVNSAKTQVTIVSDSDLASATDSAVSTVASGNDILIRRISNRTAKKVDFAPGSVIREADLDNANTQVFHVAQEAMDTALQSMVLDTDSKWNAQTAGVNRNVKNVATPGSSDPDHYVATKGYVDGTSTTATVSAIADEVTTVAGISTDVTTVAGAIKETIAYTLTESGSKFFIAGGEFSSATTNPILNLQRGSTYTFDYSSTTISSGSHVLGFSSVDTNTNNSGAVAYTTGVTDNSTTKVITFVVPTSAPSTLYYYCTAHNAMGNTINVAEDSIEIVADNIANVNKVGAIDSNVTTVAGIDSNVTTVAGIYGNVTTVAGIGTNGADVTTVAGKSTEIDVLVNKYDGSTTATSGTNKNITQVDTVADAVANVNTVATNISHVNNFNDTYHTPSGTEPTGSSVTEGDLWYDTANDVLKIYDGSSWGSASSSISTVASQNEFSASNGQGTDSKYFALTHDVGLELVFLNGVRLKRGDDYYCTNSNTSTTAITSGNAATFVRLETVPGSNDILSVMAFGQIANNLAVNTSGGTFTGAVTFEGQNTHNTGSNTFTMPTTRGTNNYILTRDDTAGTGGTAWKETMLSPTITSLTYPTGDDGNATTALDSGSGSGTQTLIINGTNFTATVTSVQITVGGVTSALGGSYVRNDAQTITVSNVVKRAVGTYTITVTNDTSQTATSTVDFSGTPSFTTLADLGTVFTGSTLSKTIATSGGDGTITLKADPNGTAKPTWMTIGGTGSGSTTWTEVTGSAGLSTALAGTTANSGDAQTYNFGIIVRDSQNQGSDREFSLIVTDYPIGGTITEPGSYSGGGYRSHKFSYSTSSTTDQPFTLYGTVDVDIFIIAGGGGGGLFYGSGGGAGGVRIVTGQTLTAGLYNIRVGGGGPGGTNSSIQGNDGDNSSFINSTGTSISIEATGGGGAAGNGSNPADYAGRNGGSGGGGKGGRSGGTLAGTGINDGGTFGTATFQGYNGGVPSTDTSSHAGGGGGSGGGGGGGSYGYNGGTGITRSGSDNWIDGTSGTTVGLHQFGGGGAGQGSSGNGTATFGGGNASNSTPTSATANSGGGGGAGSDGGAGGSGIVIIRYAV